MGSFDLAYLSHRLKERETEGQPKPVTPRTRPLVLFTFLVKSNKQRTPETDVLVILDRYRERTSGVEVIPPGEG